MTIPREEEPAPARKTSRRKPAPAAGGLSEESVRGMVVTGFAMIGAMAHPAIREQEGDLWEIDDQEARSMSEPAARILARLSPEQAAAVEKYWDPVILVVALKCSLYERLVTRGNISKALRTQAGRRRIYPAPGGIDAGAGESPVYPAADVERNGRGDTLSDTAGVERAGWEPYTQ